MPHAGDQLRSHDSFGVNIGAENLGSGNAVPRRAGSVRGRSEPSSTRRLETLPWAMLRLRASASRLILVAILWPYHLGPYLHLGDGAWSL
jgi:hypothetical protein